MKKLTRFLLNFIQKLGLDIFMIKISKNKYLRKLLLRVSWDDANYNYFENIYTKYNNLLSKYKVNIKNKNILEVGAGSSIGAGYFFLDKGYNLWIASDPFRHPNDNRYFSNKEYNLALEIAEKKNKAIKNFIDLRDGEVIFKDKFNFVKDDITKFNKQFVNKFDLILSNAVFEHISKEKMNESFRNMYKYLKKGGIMIHEIDLRDHVNIKGNPFNFYRFSEKEWENLTKGTIFYTNRLRVDDFYKVFKNNKLKIVGEVIKKGVLPKHISKDISLKYSPESLKINYLLVILRK